MNDNTKQTLRNAATEDVEAHGYKGPFAPEETDEVEGHGYKGPFLPQETGQLLN
jgi:hypothetical protein